MVFVLQRLCLRASPRAGSLLEYSPFQTVLPILFKTISLVAPPLSMDTLCGSRGETTSLRKEFTISREFSSM
jgi:hypothetical protein